MLKFYKIYILYTPYFHTFIVISKLDSQFRYFASRHVNYLTLPKKLRLEPCLPINQTLTFREGCLLDFNASTSQIKVNIIISKGMLTHSNQSMTRCFKAKVVCFVLMRLTATY